MDALKVNAIASVTQVGSKKDQQRRKSSNNKSKKDKDFNKILSSLKGA